MEKQINEFIDAHPDWYLEDDQLVAGFEFESFAGVEALISDLMLVIQKHDHHPTVTFTYSTVEIKTTTHDTGNTVTEKDLALAAEVSSLLE